MRMVRQTQQRNENAYSKEMNAMKKIIVAGAGHGGISAAATLAKNGYDVTVYEKEDRERLGHDWHDICDKPAFDFADIPLPPEDSYSPGYDMAYLNPSHSVKIVKPYSDPENLNMMIDRKKLSCHLINYAEECGVKFVFGAKINGPVTDGTKVTGITFTESGEEKTVYGDLVIDAAGMDSPVRRNLPEDFSIQNEISFDECFDVYRAYFINTTGDTTDPKYSVYFYHCGVPGMSWAITEPEFVDILVGKFGELTEDEINESIEEMRKLYPDMGDKIIRGGYRAKIPVRRTLSKIIADGYAAVGDSAAMTVPMNGCGIALSIKAGKILANTVISIKDEEYTTENLWKYQYKYFRFCGEKLLVVDKARQYFAKVNTETVNYCVESRILSEKEMEMTGGDFSAINLQYILEKIKAIAPKIHKMPAVIAQFRTLPSFNSVFNDMPKEYNEKDFEIWRKKYDRL